MWPAQQRGLIHRDIEPANILGTIDTGFKVSDFGSALSMTADQTQISRIGSPACMSPEQMRNEPLTHQADICALDDIVQRAMADRGAGEDEGFGGGHLVQPGRVDRLIQGPSLLVQRVGATLASLRPRPQGRLKVLFTRFTSIVSSLYDLLIDT